MERGIIFTWVTGHWGIVLAQGLGYNGDNRGFCLALFFLVIVRDVATGVHIKDKINGLGLFNNR